MRSRQTNPSSEGVRSKERRALNMRDGFVKVIINVMSGVISGLTLFFITRHYNLKDKANENHKSAKSKVLRKRS